MRPARFQLIVMALLTSVWLAAALGAAPVQAQAAAPSVLVLSADGPVSTTMAEYLERGLRQAERDGAAAVVLELNTPGGSVDIMTRMVTAIRNSPVPVIVYVTPRGAMAGSAGTVITLAGHLAAMAPETAIGAASPVGGQGEEIEETSARKLREMLTANVRALAANRPPEAIALAEATINTAEAVSAEEALAVGLIDLISPSLSDLLAQADGRGVSVAERPQTLDLAGAQVVRLEYSLIEGVLLILTNPNIVFLLLTIGVQAIFIELSSPGGWFAGFIGVICLTLAIYGLGFLPVNWFGAIFLVLAFALFFLELKAPTHGALTAAGIGSFVAGALILFNAVEVAGAAQVSVPLVIVTAIVTALTFAAGVGLALRAQRIKVRTGEEALPGKRGVARSALSPRGQVQVGGELWSAELAEGVEPVEANERVEVVAVQGLRLKVRKAE